MINLENLEKLDLRNYLKELIISDLTEEELNILVNFLKQYPDEEFIIDYIFYVVDQMSNIDYQYDNSIDNTRKLMKGLKPISEKALKICRDNESGKRFF
jgi:hypothetical protein